MRTFEKSDKLHGVCYDVRGPVLDEAKEMERRGETVLHLNTETRHHLDSVHRRLCWIPWRKRWQIQ